jgi:PKD repeat protein
VCYGQLTRFNITNKANIDSVYWDFGDGSASIQMTPSHLYAQTGNYKVRLIESFNGFNFIDSVLITIHSCVGIEDKTENCKFGIYPNPSNGFVSIETTGLLNDINATITDMYGRLITGFIIPGSKTGVTVTKKDFSAFPKGIYLFSFESNSLNKTEKIIFQ